ncbi:MAG: stage V sporulation protein AA [Lachnospiraceae bacterium]|nr:stage V sporulation protein AA [Lachnospiraceae bacterium]
MAQTTVYIKAERNTEMQVDEVFLKDIASLYCEDKTILAKVKAIKLHTFHENERKRFFISMTEVIKLVKETVSGVEVESIGEPDMIAERVYVEKKKGAVEVIKILLVSLVCFFGASFTIMAFHNDIGIVDVFAKYYELVMGETSSGFTILEISYSIGLAAGIIIFFNHIGGRRITKDPTPIEVEMSIYEEDVEKALIKTANREELESDTK